MKDKTEKNTDNCTFNPFEYSEIQYLTRTLLDKLLSESARGAVLIGTAFVDEHLKKFISDLLPNQTKSYKERLLEYPGSLSSFSSRIEMCYAFRYINFPIYNSLNALRQIRNDAAHKSEDFNFNEIKTKFNKIFSFIENSPSFIRNQAMDAMVSTKLITLKSLFQKHNISKEDQTTLAEDLLGNKEMIIKWENEQLPHWEMIIGLSILCGILSHTKDQIQRKINDQNI